jgi:hypothetical protein
VKLDSNINDNYANNNWNLGSKQSYTIKYKRNSNKYLNSNLNSDYNFPIIIQTMLN